MGLPITVSLGLLAAASIVQTSLLVRTMIAAREASRRLNALEDDFRRERTAHSPPRAHVTAAAIDPSQTAPPKLPGNDQPVDLPRGTRPPFKGRPSRLGLGPAEDPVTSPTPSRLVGGLNK